MIKYAFFGDSFNSVVARRALPLQGRFEIPIHLIRSATTFLFIRRDTGTVSLL